MKFLEKIFKSKPSIKIVFTEKSLQVYKNEYLNEEVYWTEVEEIKVFKRDYGMYDCICIVFYLTNDQCFEIDEEINGYKETLEKIPTIFNGIRQDWFTDVAFPAFETNLTTLWKRE